MEQRNSVKSCITCKRKLVINWFLFCFVLCFFFVLFVCLFVCFLGGLFLASDSCHKVMLFESLNTHLTCRVHTRHESRLIIIHHKTFSHLKERLTLLLKIIILFSLSSGYSDFTRRNHQKQEDRQWLVHTAHMYTYL